MEEELLSPVMMVPLEQERFTLSSSDASESLPSPADYCLFEDLLCRVAGELNISLEEIQDTA